MKVATFNISHCQDFSITKADDAPVNIEKYGKYIQEIDADVVILNEVYMQGDCEELREQTKKLSKLAGYPYYMDAIGKALPWASIGNAILSKYPIEKYESIPVFAPTEEEKREGENEWYEDRVIICATLNVGEKRIKVVGTHFGLNGLEQERMVDKIISLIDKEEGEYILMGDFNLEPDSEVLKPIFNKMQSAQMVMGNTQKTFSTYNEEITIDYIFVSKGIKINDFKRIDENASDHFPCVATITLEI